MASSMWHTDLYAVYPTLKNILNRDYCRLCISVLQPRRCYYARAQG